MIMPLPAGPGRRIVRAQFFQNGAKSENLRALARVAQRERVCVVPGSHEGTH